MTSAETSKDVLQGAEIAVAGRFASMSQAQVAALIREFGGKAVQAPNRRTSLLVLGEGGLPLADDGQPASHLEKARRLQARGCPLEIVGEEAFLARLGQSHGEEGVRRLCTLVQLGRVLQVRGDRIRAWLRAGLIEPTETVNRLPLFDYHQVAGAKTICELIEAGLPPAKIRQGLEQLRRLLPEVDSPLSQVSLLEASSQLLVRLASGQLAEPSGQLHLDFDPAAGEEATLTFQPLARSADNYFEEAVALETARRFKEAVAAYRQAMALEPHDPILPFNLGNVFYQLEQYSAAVEQYRRAVQLDPGYVEAWNNLGNAHFELHEFAEAIATLRKALSLVPTYADAYFNLAESLAQHGQLDEACQHWLTYLKFDSSSPWAERVRQNLEKQRDRFPRVVAPHDRSETRRT